MKQHLLKYKIWYIGIAIGLSLLAIWYFFIHEKSEEKMLKSISIDDNSNKITTDQPINWNNANDNFPLKLGSKGDKVKALQTWLKNVGEQKIAVDGMFGKDTETALMSFKQRNNVSEDYYNKIGINTFIQG